MSRELQRWHRSVFEDQFCDENVIFVKAFIYVAKLWKRRSGIRVGVTNAKSSWEHAHIADVIHRIRLTFSNMTVSVSFRAIGLIWGI